MAGALCIIVLFRLFKLTHSFYFLLLPEAVFFLALIFVTSIGFSTLSRILICWAPPIFLIINLKVLILHVPVPETSHYLGFRIFQIAFSFFPFLIFNISETKKFFTALLVPVLIVVGYDSILDLIGVGYFQLGLTDTSYLYNTFRTTVAFIIIGSAFIFLKSILEKQELLNRTLIEQLGEQNIVIQKNSKRALKKAYERLSYHINNTPLAVIERDKNFKIIYWNKRAEELFGWSVDEVVGLKPQQFIIHDEDRQIATQRMNDSLEKKRESDFMEIRAVTKDGRTLNCLWYYSFLRDEQGDLDTVLSFVSDITEQRKANYYLKERVKELHTLYEVSQLLATSVTSMSSIFERLPDLLSKGWQFPDICGARLIVFEKIFQTPNFADTKWMQSADIQVNGKIIGSVDVAYIKEKPEFSHGAFLTEEKHLITVISQMLQVYIERKFEEEELHKTQANLTGVINNTEILIWSVDINLNIITFNDASRHFALKHYQVDVAQSRTLDMFPPSVREKWLQRYNRVLTGELMTFEESVLDMDLKYSLSPIIENKKIIGVVVFVDNITDQNQRNRDLTEANKKISNLKMMALRSVMNPHFIFNVLSSIQYFITRNDELNAINYLTSFSKLMRTVLTRSVADSVSLKDELDLLRDYVHLEKLRFEEMFEFNIECEKAIDADDVMMPSLLIQPYVENAILHGLYNKEGKGSLVVRVSLIKDFLHFEVEDDGVGRVSTQKIRANSESKKQSMGTQLTEERLVLLNDDSQPPVVYKDLYDGDHPAGTLVTIRVKINPN
jgi:PAS domain S-box-containing protein